MTTVGPQTDIPRQPGPAGRGRHAGTGDGPARPVRRPRVRARVFRPRRMVPATIVAVVLIVVSAFVAAGIIAALAGRRLDILHPGAVASWLAGLRWHDAIPLAVGVVAMVVGLILLVAAVKPGRAKVVALACDEPDVVIGLTRRGVRCVAAVAAGDVDGVERARARVRGRRVRVKVTTPLREASEVVAVGERARQAAERALDELDLARPVKVAVRVRKGG